MLSMLNATPDSYAVAKLSTGWHVHQHHDLVAGYRLAIDTFQCGTGIASVASTCAVDQVGIGAQRHARLAPMCKPGAHLLAERRNGLGRYAVVNLHESVATPGRVAELIDATMTRYRLMSGDEAVQVAAAALAGDSEVHTIQRVLCTAGACVARGRVVAALEAGFALSDEYADLQHPIVTLIDGVRTFIEVRADALATLDALAVNLITCASHAAAAPVRLSMRHAHQRQAAPALDGAMHVLAAAEPSLL